MPTYPVDNGLSLLSLKYQYFEPGSLTGRGIDGVDGDDGIADGFALGFTCGG